MITFKEWLLLEFPLSHLGVKTHPDNDHRRDLDKLGGNSQKWVSGYFSTKDKILISHPRTAKILEDKLKKIGYNFNIIFYESTQHSGLPPDQYVEEIEEYMKENGLQKENHITFAKNSSSGDPLTSWMILHTLGHAVNEHSKDSSGFQSILAMAINGCLRNTEFDLKTTFRDDLAVLKKLFKFKSIGEPNGNILQFQEVIHELVVEYLWHGAIRTTSPDQRPIAQCIESKIKLALNDCVGQIIFDWYSG